MNFKKTITTFAILSFGFFTANAQVTSTSESQGSGAIYIKLGEAKGKKSRVALPSLQYTGVAGSNPKHNSVGAELFQVISNDLLVSTYFEIIPQAGYVEDSSKTSLRPAPADPQGFKFEAWKQISAEFLIRGAFSVAGDQVTLEAYTYHVPKAELVFGKKYKGPLSTVRRIAHSFANDLLQALTGKAGPFLSRVVVASDRAGGSYKEIYVMDWDGAGSDKITSHRSISLSPAWSPDYKQVAYTSFVQSAKSKTRNADLFIFDLVKNKRWLVSYREGMNSRAVFFPDGQNLLLTLSSSGTPDIFKLSTDGSLVSRITNGPRGAMNVEPAISPDGKRIAFSSDRSGQPMIYTMNIDGSDVKRLTFAGKYNATPAWSPDGKMLAFSGWTDTNFDIFVIDVEGTNLRRITTAKKPNGRPANNEDPVFSADSRLLMFTSNRTGQNQIYISNLDGSEERRITTDRHNYYKPKWSANIE